MARRALIAGAGIGGLAAALALRQRGMEVTVLEAAAHLGEVGAGIQLGPNAMHVLAALGLEQAVLAVACQPQAIVIHDAASTRPIQRLLLGQAVRERYGQAYVSVHRADLHALLLQAATAAGVVVQTSHSLQKYEQTNEEIRGLGADFSLNAEVLVGADGLWSRVRTQMLGDAPPRPTGHTAFRTTVPAEAVPTALRSQHVRLWWGRAVHVVSYPMRSGRLWNLVVLAQGGADAAQGWSLQAAHEEVMPWLPQAEPQLASLLQAAAAAGSGWRRWNLFDRDPLSAVDLARGRVALLGDAAHPMLPYLAQGAGMAIEDAWVLAQALHEGQDIPSSLRRYAQMRAARCARVVQTARRNAWIFHLSGPIAKARDAYLSLQGSGTIGMGWLYGFNPCASAPLARSD
jgi:salicylate hydroxylase